MIYKELRFVCKFSIFRVLQATLTIAKTIIHTSTLSTIIMRSSTAIAFAFLVASASAFPHLTGEIKRDDDHFYRPQQPGEFRSPCPGTNTLANHGYINRDGKGITKDAYLQGFLDGFGFDSSGIVGLATTAFVECNEITGSPCDSIDLWMLNLPHGLEHDGSLSRSDKNETWNHNTDYHTFNESIWDKTLDYFGGATHIDFPLAHTALFNRIAEQEKIDTPGWFVENVNGSLLEHAFILSTMNDPEVNPSYDPNVGAARLDWVNHWFQQEELPTALGWKKPAPISATYLQTLFSNVLQATSTAPPPGHFTPAITASATLDNGAKPLPTPLPTTITTSVAG